MSEYRLCKRGHEQTPENKSQDGRCKLCRQVAHKNYREANKEKLREQNKIWVANNIDRVRETKQRWATLNKEQALAASRKHYASNKERYREWRIANHGKRMFRKHQRRMAVQTRTYEIFSAAEIYARDNYVCGICGEPVDITLKRPNLLSPSIDHIIPIAKGGHHTRDNVHLTHLICNLRKGIKVGIRHKTRTTDVQAANGARGIVG